MYRFPPSSCVHRHRCTDTQEEEEEEETGANETSPAISESLAHTRSQTEKEQSRERQPGGLLCIWSCKYLMCRARSERSTSMRNKERKRVENGSGSEAASITRSTELSEHKRRKGLDVDQDGCCLTSRDRRSGPLHHFHIGSLISVQFRTFSSQSQSHSLERRSVSTSPVSASRDPVNKKQKIWLGATNKLESDI